MPGVDPEMGVSALRLWVAASAAALLVVCCVIAFLAPFLRARRPFLVMQNRHAAEPTPFREEGTESAAEQPALHSAPRSSPAAQTSFLLAGTPISALARVGFVVLVAVFGAVMTWPFGSRPAVRDGERQAFMQRSQALAAPTLAPGSPLACLDALGGDGVEAGCERALFASAASVASATSFVAARLSLVAEIVATSGRSNDFEDVLLPLRRSLEIDRFGFLAHVLAVRDGCTGENCKALALLRDPARVRANLSAETFDRFLEHYVPIWAKTPEVPVADATPAQPAGGPMYTGQTPRKSVLNLDFPTAASIPAVSIMNPEPKGPVLPGVAAAAAANPNPPAAGSSAPRHPRKQAVTPPPVPAAPAGATSGVEPIWPEPVPPAPGAPPAGAARGNGTPAPPEASAGTPIRAQ